MNQNFIKGWCESVGMSQGSSPCTLRKNNESLSSSDPEMES